MSFVYMPIPGCSVHSERQLHAALGPSPACWGTQPPGLGMGKVSLMGPTSPTRHFEGFLACHC